MWVPDGLACIATTLRRAGHEVVVHMREEKIDKNGFDWDAADREFRGWLQEFRPEVVGLSVNTPGVPEGCAFAALAKELCGRHVLVVAGGPHPTALPEGLLGECPSIDVAAVGEGELTMAELAEKGPSPSVAGIVFRDGERLVRTPPRPLVRDLDTLGPPAYDLFDMDYYTRPNRWLIRYLPRRATNVRTSRGCTNRCQFCAGITPFIAILRDLSRRGKIGGNSLIFSNKTRDDILLEKELRHYLGDRCLFTLTHESSPGYERRLVDQAFLKEKVRDFKQAFYVCGPPQMVEDVGGILRRLGARPNHIVFER